MTLKQIAEALESPESTVRIYRDEFAEFIPATGEGRRRRYESGAVETLKKIVGWEKEGIGSATIRQELARTFTPQEKRRVMTQEDRIAAISMALESQNSEIAMLRAEVAMLRSAIGKLVVLLSSDQQEGETMESVQRRRVL